MKSTAVIYLQMASDWSLQPEVSFTSHHAPKLLIMFARVATHAEEGH